MSVLAFVSIKDEKVGPLSECIATGFVLGKRQDFSLKALQGLGMNGCELHGAS